MKRRDLLILSAGAGITAALSAGAQQKPMPVIGYLSSTSPGSNAPWVEAFRQGLQENGYVDGQNLAIEYRWAASRYDRLPALPADLVARKVDVIAASGGLEAAVPAKNATSTTPIVFFAVSDPVGNRLIASLARPGGNVTGVSPLSIELMPKRLELLSELVPQAGAIALLVNPNNQQTERVIGDVEEAARAKGVQLPVLKASTESEIDAAFASLAQLRIGALIVTADPFFGTQRDHLAALASRYSVATIYPWREAAAAGGLISYGSSIPAACRLAGILVARILKGSKPADLPVEQLPRFELVVNLKTAKALGITVPPSILARADEVIE